jgi:organic radical activating enzyme
LYLVEHFYSIQGEGKYAGRSSIFLRFGLCNLTCKGFKSISKSKLTGETLIGCDSLYAVDKRHFSQTWQEIESIEFLNNIIDSYEKSLDFKPDIVITGGEPLLHHKNDIFYKFIENKSKTQKITIETNATITIDFKRYPAYKDTMFAMSIKLANSDEKKEKRINKEAINSIILNSNDNFFKFVLNKEYIFEYGIKEIKEITEDFRNSDIYCMSVGDSVFELNKHDREIIEFCKKHNFIYSDRLHIRIYNQRAGV